MSESFRDRAARLQAEADAQRAAEAGPSFDDDLVPEAPTGGPRPAQSDELDRVIDGLDILDAYRRWVRKTVGDKSGHEIMVSCPLPGHADEHPSASLNLEKQLWVCHACQEGGDKYDFAAAHFGFPVPGYKSKNQFPELRKRMSQDLGVSIQTTPSGRSVVVPASAPAAPPAPAKLAAVVALPAPPPEDPTPSIDWRSILPEGTFLHGYVAAASASDLPDEFHFMLAAQLAGSAVGRNAFMRSNPAIRPNFYNCLLGATGIGKSTAIGMQGSVAEAAIPYDHDNPDSSGTYLAPDPGSGEALYDTFSKPVYDDPDDPKKVTHYASIRAIVEFDEMSALASKAMRQGSTLKSALIRLFDGRNLAIKSRGSGLVVINEPFCQVVAGTQPHLIRKVLQAEDADSGYINRWIFATGPRKRLDPHRVAVFDTAPHVEPLRQLRAWASMQQELVLEGQSLALWERFFRAVIEPIRQGDEDAPLLNRADLHLKKFILMFAINERSSVILPRHVEAAIEVVWPYLKGSYGILAGQLGMGEIDACQAAIIEAIQKHTGSHGRPPSAANLNERYLRRRFTTPVQLAALKNLCTLGIIRELDPPENSRGRPSRRYELTG